MLKIDLYEPSFVGFSIVNLVLSFFIGIALCASGLYVLFAAALILVFASIYCLTLMDTDDEPKNNLLFYFILSLGSPGYMLMKIMNKLLFK
jgi:formate hydrogenlyase subunit 3/multisubunit Na+/H+ antiporter MnhD subunit